MKEEDLEKVMEIERRSFVSPWSEGLFREELWREFSNPLVAVDPDTGETVGYIVFWVIHDECHILNIAVDPSRRREGIGEKLMKACEEVSREGGASYLYLEVRESNLPAINLYRKLGYRFFGLRKGYYTDTKEDAWVMVKILRRRK